MKKIIAAAICLSLLCGFTSCTVRDDDSSETTTTAEVTSADTTKNDDDNTTTTPSGGNNDKVSVNVSDSSINYKAGSLVWATMANNKENGAVFELVFDVKSGAKDGLYDINIANIDCCDEDYQDIAVEPHGGKIRIGAGDVPATATSDKFALALSGTTATAGSEAKINLEFLNNPGIAGTTFIIYYDKDALELKTVNILKDSMKNAIFDINTTLDCDFVVQ